MAGCLNSEDFFAPDNYTYIYIANAIFLLFSWNKVIYAHLDAKMVYWSGYTYYRRH